MTSTTTLAATHSIAVLFPNDSQGRRVFSGVFGTPVTHAGGEDSETIDIILDENLVDASALFDPYKNGAVITLQKDEVQIIHHENPDVINSIKATLGSLLAQSWEKQYDSLSSRAPSLGFTAQALNNEKERATSAARTLMSKHNAFVDMASFAHLVTQTNEDEESWSDYDKICVGLDLFSDTRLTFVPMNNATEKKSKSEVNRAAEAGDIDLEEGKLILFGGEAPLYVTRGVNASDLATLLAEVSPKTMAFILDKSPDNRYSEIYEKINIEEAAQFIDKSHCVGDSELIEKIMEMVEEDVSEEAPVTPAP